IVNVLGITELTEALPNTSIDVLTNGYITLTEKTGDLRVGRIKSTTSDVLLYAPRMIIDALADGGPSALTAAADVTGESITLCPGSALLATPGTAANPMCASGGQAVGGVG